ncbi:MAG: sigma-70 family RNA polymerase sigma factor [Leptospiraceae bacterium]|nr:sigma-70 family RNA polymerase sigma factor [Leptospiraceae bacterium]
MINNEEVNELIRKTLSGNAESLNQLLKIHQDYIYNICRSMYLNPMDSEDVTQEILIKIISNLSKFDETKSQFSTWIYRITVNHVLNVKKQRLEELTSDFDAYGKDLDSIPLEDFQKEELSRPETKLLIEEARIGCSVGMLLCLDREQRIVFVLGEIMRMNHKLAAEILEISPENYRQKLSRARKDLFNFMENQCGLINQSNPCRCAKKTIGFIKKGYVDKNNLKFANEHLKKIKEFAEKQDCIEDEFYEKGYDTIYDENPFYETPKKVLEKILLSLEPEFIKN